MIITDPDGEDRDDWHSRPAAMIMIIVMNARIQLASQTRPRTVTVQSR